MTITEEEVGNATELQSTNEMNVLEEAVNPGIESLTFKP